MILFAIIIFVPTLLQASSLPPSNSTPLHRDEDVELSDEELRDLMPRSEMLPPSSLPPIDAKMMAWLEKVCPLVAMRLKFETLLEQSPDQVTILNWAREKLISFEQEMELFKKLHELASPQGITIMPYSREADGVYRMIVSTLFEQKWFGVKDMPTVCKILKLFEPHVSDGKSEIINSMLKYVERQKIADEDRATYSITFLEKAMEDAKLQD